MKKFDRDKYLKQLKFKRVWCKYERYFYIGVPCLIIALLVMCTILNKNVIFENNKVYLDNAIGAYIDGEYSKTIPGKSDGYVVQNIVCDNGAVGTWENDKWGLLTTNMTRKSKCNIYFETNKTFAGIIEAASSDTSIFATDDPDNNIRYIGADPSNYVYFNCSDYNNQSDNTCEKWRIIGVFNNVTKSDGTKENLVKIIRDESIGNYSWDSSVSSINRGYGVNDWTDSDVMKLLNPGYESESAGGSLYYNAKSGTCYCDSSNTTTSCDFTSTGLKNDITRNTIESAVWNLGGANSYSSSSNGLASHWYGYERGTTVYSGRPTTWTGKIGLMYPSDYGYATGGGSSINRTLCLAKELLGWDSSSYTDCKNNDYLFKSSYAQWTLASNSGFAHYVFRVYTLGDVAGNYAYLTRGVRPTLYLKSNISVKSGDGTSEIPYQLNL